MLGLYNYDIKSGKFFFYKKENDSNQNEISKVFKFGNNLGDEKEIDDFESSYVDRNYSKISNQEFNNSEMNTKKRNKNLEFKFNEESEITEEKLNEIYNKVDNYFCSEKLFNDLKEAESIIKPKERKNEFNFIISKRNDTPDTYEKYRWFLVYKDIEEEIKQCKNLINTNDMDMRGLKYQINLKNKKFSDFEWSIQKSEIKN